MPSCPNCGREANAADRFCRICGTPTHSSSRVAKLIQPLLKDHDSEVAVSETSPTLRKTETGQRQDEANRPIHPSSRFDDNAGNPRTKISDTYSDTFTTLTTKTPTSRKVSSRATTLQEMEEPEPERRSATAPVLADRPKGGEDVRRLRALLRRIQELERERDQLKEKLWKTKGRPSRLLAILMLALGAIALVSSVVYAVTVLAFIGLGLTFWGALILQIRPSGYLKAELMDSALLSPIKLTDQLLGELGYGGNGIYMRDKTQETVVFVPAANGLKIPSSSQLGNSVFLDSPKGAVLTPPGRSLAYLLEDELGGRTSMGDLAGLQGRLTKVLIENLEIVKDFEMQLEAGHVRLRFVDSVYADLSKELEDSTRICSTMGCPICSAMGCILAASTMRPVAFEGESLSENGRIMEAHYRILQED